MTVPSPWVFVLLALAAWRTWKLLAEDEILGRPLGEIRRRCEGLVGCPFCLGAWLAILWWGAWQVWPHGSLVAAAPFAISAAVGVVAVTVNKLADD